MKATKLVRILKAFTKEEFKEFEKFTASPYFTKGRNLIPFFDVLKQFYPEFDREEFTNKNIFTKLFPGKSFHVKRSNDLIKTLSHELIRICDEFLAHSKFKDDINKKNYYLLSRLREKKLYGEFEKKYSTAVTYINNNHGGSLYDFIDNYYLLDAYTEFCIERGNYKSAFETIASQDEIAAVIALIRGYRGFEFKYLAESYNLKSSHNFSEQLIKNLDSDKVLKILKENNDRYYPYIALNHMSYMISEYPAERKYYFEFKKLIYENLHLFGHIEKYILFSRLTTYCGNVLIKSPDKFFMREEFEIYDKTLELGLHKWSDKDDFSIHHFRNIVFCANDLKEFTWIENFVNKFADELAPTYRESMKNYSFALLNYERKEYEKALENILKIKINFPHYKLDIKNLMFKIYYDMNLYEQAYSILESMRQYIPAARELPAVHKAKSKTFVQYARKLLRLKSSRHRGALDFFEKDITGENSISSKEWLLEKAKELKEKNLLSDF